MTRFRRRAVAFLSVLSLLLSLFCGLALAEETQTGIVRISSGSLNVRSGPGTRNSVIGSLYNGDTVTVLDSVKEGDTLWHHIRTANGLVGYVSAAYITIQAVYTPDADFEAYLTSQNFPESYKPALRELHAAYPNWVFVAKQLNLDWNTALAAEAQVGRNLVSSGAKNSWKSMEYGAYDWTKKSYVVFDSGGWVSAQKEVIAYYMDPRNFLNDVSIFQFESLSYSPVHTADGVKNILKGSFMESLADTFISTAKSSGVSAYHLASRALQEQGKNGNALGRGTAAGYAGYYNIFNIGAYQTSSGSAIENGAKYAKARGWNTAEKAIAGSAEQLGAGYIKMGQDTLYLQKFDVVNGGNGYYSHQYMTNVSASASEASMMKNAYTADVLQGTMVFSIPVYSNMPSAACAAPTSGGNNDNTLTAISVSGYTLTPTFSRYTAEYALTVPDNLTAVTLNTTRSDSGASVSGAGEIRLSGAETTAQIKVTAPSGLVRTYTVHIYRPGAEGTPAFGTTKYTVGTYITGIEPGTTAQTLLQGLPVRNGSVQLVTANGAAVSDKVATGQTVQLVSGGKVYYSYPVVIYGDVSGDGAVTSKDLLMAQKHILEISQLSGAYLAAADSGKDGAVTSSDLLRSQKQILGLIKPIV